MSFYVDKKFEQDIRYFLLDFLISSKRDIYISSRLGANKNDEATLKKILDVQVKTDSGFTLEKIETLCNSKIISKLVKEKKFANGIILVDSNVAYLDQEKNRTDLRQIFVTTDYETKPIINLVIKEKRIPLIQLICGASDVNGIIDRLKKSILVKEVTVDVGIDYSLTFTSYTDLDKDNLLVEKFKKNYYSQVKTNMTNKNEFLDLLDCNSTELEFLYIDNNVIYTQTKDKERINTENAIKGVEKELDKFKQIFEDEILKIDFNHKRKNKKLLTK